MTDPKDQTSEGGSRPRPAREGAPARPASGAGQRPTPVRQGMPGEASAAEDVPAPETEFETADGGRWKARVAGRGRAGSPGDPAAPLLLLVFEPAEPREPEGADPRREAREALVVADTLDGLSEDRLRELLDASRPVGFEPGDFFPGTRRGRQRG